jgi:DNA-binding response OmpR family regulator
LLEIDGGIFCGKFDHRANPIHLMPKEYSLLELLLRNGRRVLSRSVMLEHVCSLQSPPEEPTVKVHIRGVRQKLKAAGADEDSIETVHGIGYRLKQLDICNE